MVSVYKIFAIGMQFSNLLLGGIIHVILSMSLFFKYDFCSNVERRQVHAIDEYI